MEFTSLNESDRFLSYPTNKIIGMVSTPDELHAAIAELNAAGFGEAQVQVLCGSKGAARLDVTGERHGFLARLYRFVEKFGDMESKHLSDYKSELLNGHFLLAVDVRTTTPEHESSMCSRRTADIASISTEPGRSRGCFRECASVKAACLVA